MGGHIVILFNESELNSMDNKKVEATMDRHSTPRRKQKRKETNRLKLRLIETIRDSLNPKQIETV